MVDEDLYDWQGCTGVAAVWCPVHGDCACRCDYHACPVKECDDCLQREERIDASKCPLHDLSSTHGDSIEKSPEEAIKAALERARAQVAQLERRLSETKKT